YFNTQIIRVPGVGNAFQKTVNDNYKGEREMSVCEMQRDLMASHKQFGNALKDYDDKVALAKLRGVKLTKEQLAVATKEPFSVGIGKVYCQFLAQLKIKQLLAQAPAAAKPIQNATLRDRVREMSSHPPVTPAAAPLKADTVPRASEITQNAVIPGQVESARLQLIDALRNINAYEVEIQKKFALAAACFIFVLLGAPIALRFPRGGVGLTIGVSLVVFGIYYVGLIAGESLARRGMLPPVVSMWIANVVFGLIALVLLARLGMESGSSRSGDLREVLETISYKLKRRPARARRVTVPRATQP
ncbi:MAG: LptF/LptG family permease, partial [Thermoanaerobaculia bacterium]